jgi:hypothetical protein
MVIGWLGEAGPIADELKKELAAKDRPEID